MLRLHSPGNLPRLGFIWKSGKTQGIKHWYRTIFKGVENGAKMLEEPVVLALHGNLRDYSPRTLRQANANQPAADSFPPGEAFRQLAFPFNAPALLP